MSRLSSQFQYELKKVQAQSKIATSQTAREIQKKQSVPKDVGMYTFDYDYYKPTLNNGNYTPAIVSFAKDMGLGFNSAIESFYQVTPTAVEFSTAMANRVFENDTSVVGTLIKKGADKLHEHSQREIQKSQAIQNKLQSEASNKWTFLAGSAVGQTGIGVLASIGSLGLGTAMMFSPAVASVYNEARKKHSPEASLGIATLYGIPAYYAEKVGLRSILGQGAQQVLTKSKPARLLSSIKSEIGTEVAQQAWENGIMKFFNEDKRNWWDGLIEAGFGSLFGGGVGALGVMAGQSAFQELQNRSVFYNTIKENNSLGVLYDGFRKEGLSQSQARNATIDVLETMSKIEQQAINELSQRYEQQVESERIARERQRLNEIAGKDMSIVMKATINNILNIDKLAEQQEAMKVKDIVSVVKKVRDDVMFGRSDKQKSLFDTSLLEGTQASLFEDSLRSWLLLDVYKGLENEISPRLLNPALSQEREQRMNTLVNLLAQDTGTTLRTDHITIDTGLNPDGTYNVEVVVDGEKKQDMYPRSGRFETEEEALYYGKKKAEKHATTPVLFSEQKDLTKDFQAWQSERDTKPVYRYEQITDPVILELAKDVPQKFRLNEQIYDIVKSVGSKLYTRGGARGVMGSVLRKSKTMFLRGTNLVSVAGHEVMHVVAESTGLPDIIIKNSPELYQQLEAVYQKYDPKPDTSASPNTIVHEGLALSFQKMLESPTQFKEQFPFVVQELFEKDGTYYNEQVSRAFDRFRVLIAQYQGLEAIEKMEAQLSGDRENSTESPFSQWEQMRTLIFDNNFLQLTIEKSLGMDYFKNTTPLSLIRQQRAVYNAISNNVAKEGNGYFAFRGDEWVKTLQYNWADLYTRLSETGKILNGAKRVEVEKFINSFNAWLFARRIHFAHKRLADMKTELKSLGDPDDINISVEDLSRYEALSQGIETLEDILTKDYIDPKEAETTYIAGKNLFEKQDVDGVSFAEMYDALTAEDLETEFVHGIITEEVYKTLKDIKGYAPLLRTGQDDFTQAVDSVVSTLMTNEMSEGTEASVVANMKKRTGGYGAPVKNPLLASIYRHQVVTRMVYMNEAKKRTVEMLLHHTPELVREEAWTSESASLPNRVEYIHEGKRKVVVMESFFYKAFIANFNLVTFKGIGRALEIARNIYTTGTTGTDLGFMITNMFMVDSFSGAINTREAKVSPFFEGAKTTYLRARRTIIDKLNTEDTLTPEQREILSYADEYINLFAYGDTMTTALTMSDRDLARFYSQDRAQGANFQEKLVDGLERLLTVQGLEKTWKQAFKLLEKGSMEAEMFNRLGEYVLSRKRGDPQLVSAQKASEVTVDFGKRGLLFKTDMGKFATLYTYFMSAIASVNTMIDQTAPAKLKRVAVANLLWIIMSHVGVATIFGNIFGESEEDRKKRQLAYQEKTTDERARYIYYALPGGQLGRWRILEGTSAIATIMNMLSEESLGMNQFDLQEYFNIPLEAIPQQFKPWETVEWFVSLIPKGIDVGTGLAIGKRLYPTGADIVPKNLQNLPKRLQKDERTSWLAELLAKDFISPIEVDFVLEQTFGRSIKMFTKPKEYFGQVTLTPTAQHYPFSGRMVRVFFEERARLDNEIRAWETNNSDKTEEEIFLIKQERDKIEPLNELLQTYTDLRKKDPEEKNPMTKKAYNRLITSLQNYYR